MCNLAGLKGARRTGHGTPANFSRDSSPAWRWRILCHKIADALTNYLQDLANDLASATHAADYWRRVGEEFMLRSGRIHFNCGSIGATPRSIVAAHKAYLDRMEADPYAHAWSGFEDAGSEAVLDKARQFIGARTRSEMLLTRNTTEAMNLVATGIRWQPGDEVLTTDHEHPRRYHLLAAHAANGRYPRATDSLRRRWPTRVRSCSASRTKLPHAHA